MKHLSKFIQYLKESNKSIISNINDIFLDLSDIGFKIREISDREFIDEKYGVSFRSYDRLVRRFHREITRIEKIESLSFTINKVRNTKSSFNINDVEDTIRRIIDYMKSEGFNEFEVRKATNVRSSVDITDKFDKSRKFSKRNKEELRWLYLRFIK